MGKNGQIATLPGWSALAKPVYNWAQAANDCSFSSPRKEAFKTIAKEIRVHACFTYKNAVKVNMNICSNCKCCFQLNVLRNVAAATVTSIFGLKVYCS